jgi:hypothetical protein
MSRLYRCILVNKAAGFRLPAGDIKTLLSTLIYSYSGRIITIHVNKDLGFLTDLANMISR